MKSPTTTKRFDYTPTNLRALRSKTMTKMATLQRLMENIPIQDYSAIRQINNRYEQLHTRLELTELLMDNLDILEKTPTTDRILTKRPIETTTEIDHDVILETSGA